jgi:hypothetical protein
MKTTRDVWMSKGHFDGDPPACQWGFEGRTKNPFPVPTPGSLLIVFDQDLKPVELWEVGTVERFDPMIHENGWTWFAGTVMSQLVSTTEDSGVMGIDFHDEAFLLLPGTGGWTGEPIKLSDRQVADLFDQIGWSTDLRCR